MRASLNDIFEITVQKAKRLSNLVTTLVLPAKEQTFFSFLPPSQTALPWQHEALPPRWRRRLRLGAAAAAVAVAEAEGLSLVWPSHAIKPPYFPGFPFCCNDEGKVLLLLFSAKINASALQHMWRKHYCATIQCSNMVMLLNYLP